jgi:hypothetical protein
MHPLHEWRAAWAFVLLGWHQTREQRLALLGQSALFVIVLVIFWQLWRATRFCRPKPSAIPRLPTS